MPPFERLLAEARREARPKTGRSKGRSPALQKADSTRVSVVVVGRESHRRPGASCVWWSCVVLELGAGFFSRRSLPSCPDEISLSFSFSRSCARGPASGLSEEARTGGAAEPLWGANLRVRVGNAGESSLTMPGAPRSGAATQGHGE